MDDSPFTPAENEAWSIAFRCAGTWALVPSLRVAVKYGIAPSMDAVPDAVEHFLGIPNPGALLSPSGATLMAPHVHRTLAQLAADAASVVFAHSILDVAVTDYLRVCAMVAPDEWFEWVKSKKVTLEEATTTPLPGLIMSCINDKIEALGRKSLVDRLRILHALAKPDAATTGSLPRYGYDEERIRKFDAVRHEIIHGANALTMRLPALDDELPYMYWTTQYVGLIVQRRYGLRGYFPPPTIEPANGG